MTSTVLNAEPSPRRDLLASLAVLAIVGLVAVVVLIVDRNWPKLVRVSAAIVTYTAVLWLLVRPRLAQPRDAQPVSYPLFAIAGAAAGLVSGLVRPTTTVTLVVAQVLTAGVLLGGVHCLAIRSWRSIRSQIVG